MSSLLQNNKNRLPVINMAWYIVVGVMIALLLLALPSFYLPILAGGMVVLFVVARNPEIGILIITILISSIVFENSLPLINFGIGSFHITDIMLFFMLFKIVYNHMVGNDSESLMTPLDLPLMLFFIIVIISVFISLIYYKTDYNVVMRAFRTICYYLMFFITTRLIIDKKQVIFIVKGITIIAIAVAIAMLAQAIVGDVIQLVPGRVEAAGTFGQDSEALRIIPPGQTLILVIYLTAVCTKIHSRHKAHYNSFLFYIIILLSMANLLTYNRNTWIGITMSLSLLMFLIPVESRNRLITLLMVSTLLIGSIVIIKENYSGMSGETSDAISNRITSLFSGKKLIQSSQLQDRFEEISYASRQIVEHPVLGIGLYTEYRPNIYGKGDEIAYFVHNNYLWIIMDMGLTGFLFYIWFYIGFIVRGLKNWKKIKDDYLRSVMLGFLLSGVAMLFMALVDPVFMYWFSIVVIALIAGLSEVIIRINAKEMKGA